MIVFSVAGLAPDTEFALIITFKQDFSIEVSKVGRILVTGRIFSNILPARAGLIRIRKFEIPLISVLDICVLVILFRDFRSLDDWAAFLEGIIKYTIGCISNSAWLWA